MNFPSMSYAFTIGAAPFSAFEGGGGYEKSEEEDEDEDEEEEGEEEGAASSSPLSVSQRRKAIGLSTISNS